MDKTATEVMQEILFCSLVQNIDALRKASKGMPNTLARDIAAIHSNSTVTDLPQELQQALRESTAAAFKRLRSAGYTVGPQDAVRVHPRPSGSRKNGPSRQTGQR